MVTIDKETNFISVTEDSITFMNRRISSEGVVSRECEGPRSLLTPEVPVTLPFPCETYSCPPSGGGNILKREERTDTQ